MLKYLGLLPWLGNCFAALTVPVLVMGTLEDGTLCAHCGINEAYYIPDGCVGPVCLFPEGLSCWDIQERNGWDGGILIRVKRFSKFKFFCLASKTRQVLEVQGITDIISQFLIHV